MRILFSILIALVVSLSSGCSSMLISNVAEDITDQEAKHIAKFYAATEKSIRMVGTNLPLIEGNIIIGRVTELPTPYIIQPYIEVYWKYGSCEMEIPVKELLEKKLKRIYIYFTTIQPLEFHVSEGDIIVIRLGPKLKNRVLTHHYQGAFAMNLSKAWREYELPLNESK